MGPLLAKAVVVVVVVVTPLKEGRGAGASKGASKAIARMESGHFDGLLEQHIRGIGPMVRGTGRETKCGPTDESTLATGKAATDTGKVLTRTLVEIGTKANGSKIIKTGKELIFGQTGPFTTVFLKMMCLAGTAQSIGRRTTRITLVHGRTVSKMATVRSLMLAGTRGLESGKMGKKQLISVEEKERNRRNSKMKRAPIKF